ncbi:hypothetical protein B566_EDAN016707 [Ephemera danica]|nr:hypothetical protein B566_EDAN016707 [Ephemera danica]
MKIFVFFTCSIMLWCSTLALQEQIVDPPGKQPINECEQLRQENAELNKKLDDTVDDVLNLRLALQNSRQEIEELQVNIAACENKIADSEAKQIEAATKVEEIQNKLRGCETSITDLNETLNRECQEKEASLQLELQKCEQIKETAEDRVNTLEETASTEVRLREECETTLEDTNNKLIKLKEILNESHAALETCTKERDACNIRKHTNNQQLWRALEKCQKSNKCWNQEYKRYAAAMQKEGGRRSPRSRERPGYNNNYGNCPQIKPCN